MRTNDIFSKDVLCNLHSALVLTHFGIFRQTHVTKGSKQYK